MNKQHMPLYISLVVVVVVGISIIYDFGQFIPRIGPAFARPGKTVATSTAVTNVALHKNGMYTRTDVDYPRFSGEPAALNAQIEKIVMDAIAEHEKNSEENWKARSETADPKGSIPAVPPESERFPLHASWWLSQLDRERVSVFLELDEFSGGAHGSERSVTFNYDLKSHKIMSIADLFPGDATYLNKLSKLAIDALIADRKKATGESVVSDDELKWITEGAGPKVENFQTFTLRGNRLTLYFGQYQVGPYAIGMPQVDLWLPLAQ